MTIHPTEYLVQGYLGVNFRVLKLKPLCSQLIRSIPVRCSMFSSGGLASRNHLHGCILKAARRIRSLTESYFNVELLDHPGIERRQSMQGLLEAV